MKVFRKASDHLQYEIGMYAGFVVTRNKITLSDVFRAFLVYYFLAFMVVAGLWAFTLYLIAPPLWMQLALGLSWGVLSLTGAISVFKDKGCIRSST